MEDTSEASGQALELQRLRELPKELVQAEFDRIISPSLAPPSVFWEPYTAEQVTTGLQACLLLWVATSSHLVPREFQLQSTISLMSGVDCLVDVGRDRFFGF